MADRKSSLGVYWLVTPCTKVWGAYPAKFMIQLEVQNSKTQKLTKMSKLRRRQRQREYADSTKSGEEMLQMKLRTLHGTNAIIWARWQQQIKFLGWIVLFHAEISFIQ